VAPTWARSQAAALDADAPGTHRPIGGGLAGLDSLLAQIQPPRVAAPPTLAWPWARDRALLQIAGGARNARLDRARSLHAQ